MARGENGQNALREGLLKGRFALGVWSALGSAEVAECLSQLGFDWMLIDMEHAPNQLRDVLAQLRAAQAGKTPIIVRPPSNDVVDIKRLMDIGVETIMIPYVETVADAAQAVQSMRYPPDGIRGVALSGTRATSYGLNQNYRHEIAHRSMLIVQIETPKGFENLNSILAVDGVDGVFVGPNDLAANLGFIGDGDRDEVNSAIEIILRKCEAHGKIPGILANSPNLAERFIKMGYRMVSVTSDSGLIVRSAAAVLQDYRSLTSALKIAQ